MDAIFRAAIERMSQAVCICDLQGQVQYINPAAERLTGCSPDLAAGRIWSDLFSEALGPEGLREVNAALASGNDQTFDVRASRGGLKISVSSLRDGFKPAGIMISAEAAFEDKYRTLFDNSSESIILTDLSGRIIEANDTAIKTLGFGRDEILVMGMIDLDSPECAHLEAARMGLLRRLGSIFFETVLSRRDGSTLPVEVISRIIELEGEPAVLSSARAGRSSWKMHYHLLQKIMDSIPSPLFFKDARGIYQGCNAAFERLLDKEKGRIIGKTAFEIYPGEIADEISVNDSDLLQHPGTQIYESHFQSKDGKRRDVIHSQSTFLGTDGRVAGLVGIIIDITDRKRSEREVVALKRKMEFVLGATRTGLDIIDPGFNIRYIDPEWKKVYGEPGGRKCFEYFFGRGCVCRGCGVELALETKKVAVTEAALVKEENRPIQITSIPYQDEQGNWLVAEVSIDIAERRRIEEEILKRDRFLAGVAVATSQLLTTPDRIFAINQALEILGCAADVDRAYIFRNHDQDGRHLASLAYEWSKDPSGSRLGRPEMMDFAYDSVSPIWHEMLTGNRPVRGLARDFPDLERRNLESMGVTSLLIVPIMVEGAFWGFIGLDDCSKERQWTWSEVSILLTVAGSIGGTIAREIAYERLRNAHQRLLSIIEFLPDATFVVDRDKRVIAWNRAIEEMTGVVKEEVMGKGDHAYALPFYGKSLPMLVDLIGVRDPLLESRYQYLERRGDTLYGEVFVPSLNNGIGAFLWAKASPLIDDQGRLIGSVESIRDITDRKMAEKELHKRDILLAGVAVAANVLLTAGDYGIGMKQALEILGLSAEVDRVYIFENHEIDGHLLTSQRFEWSREGMPPQIDNPALQNISYQEACPRWLDLLRLGEPVSGLVRDFPAQERQILEPQGIVSMLIVPIAVEGRFWGFIGFDDCSNERAWTRSEVSILTASAGSIGAAIIRKASEEALRETRDYLESLIDYASAPILVWDPSFRITRFNHAFERLVGRTSGEVLGRHLEMLFPEESRDESMANIQRTLSGERWEAVEMPVQRTDGTVRIVLWNSAAIYNKESTAVVATIAQGQDITERTQAEDEVRRLTKALDTMPSGIVLSDFEGEVEYINQGFMDLIGISDKSQILGTTISSFTDEEGGRIIDDVIVPTLISAGQWRGEMPIKRSDGSIFPAEVVTSAVQNGQGTPEYVIASFNDISRRKIMEDELLKAKDAALAAAQAKSEFLANMSHEIRTPMNAIIGMTGLMLGTALTQEQREYVETVRSCGDSLLEIINDILDFSKIERGRLELEREPFDLAECLNASIDLVASDASRKGLGLSYAIGPEVPEVIVGDAARLCQVLVNLISNAVKFTEKGRVFVDVSSKKEDGHHEILFAIEDTGIGISEEFLGKLFQSFSQVDASTTRRYGGTGLGLAIARRLVEMMGGRIWAESTPGKGSKFYFMIEAESADAGSAICYRPDLAGKKVLAIGTSSRIVSDLARSWSMLPEAAEHSMHGDVLDLERYDVLVVDAEDEELKEIASRARKQRGLPLIALISSDDDLKGLEFSAAVGKPVKASSLYNAFISIFCRRARTHAARAQEVIDSTMGERHPLKILVVEDNLVNQKVAVRMLERMGYRADIASNGLEVLQALERQHYDLVLMDIQMPEMDGLEATRRIRGQAHYQPYIIAMTAHALEGDRERCLQAGMDDYIAKPVKIEELQHALESSLDHIVPEPAVDQMVIEGLRKLQMDGEPDIIEELGLLFLDRAPGRIEAMHQALESRDPEKLSREAHNLKSSSANLGAMKLSALARDLEIMGRSGDLTRAQTLISQAEAELGRVRLALEEEMKKGFGPDLN